MGLAVSLVSVVPEKVWFLRGGKLSRKTLPPNTKDFAAGGNCKWIDEASMLCAIQRRLRPASASAAGTSTSAAVVAKADLYISHDSATRTPPAAKAVTSRTAIIASAGGGSAAASASSAGAASSSALSTSPEAVGCDAGVSIAAVLRVSTDDGAPISEADVSSALTASAGRLAPGLAAAAATTPSGASGPSAGRVPRRALTGRVLTYALVLPESLAVVAYGEEKGTATGPSDHVLALRPIAETLSHLETRAQATFLALQMRFAAATATTTTEAATKDLRAPPAASGRGASDGGATLAAALHTSEGDSRRGGKVEDRGGSRGGRGGRGHA